ncbi:MAG TPA: SAM-dependent methyltransferase, partial [Pirellulales bacterium]
DRLRTEGISTARVNSLYELKLTSSAELIAGVRACENGRLFEDNYAEQMAGQHGVAMARRFCQRSPQLGGMVAARTWHLDSTLNNYVASGGRDIVIVGVGWDMRPFRLPLPSGTRVYELDFPTTLAERARRLGQLEISEQPGVIRYQIPIDVRSMALAPTLAEHLEENAGALVIWEGMSMYFQEAEVRKILAGMMPILRRPNSLLWVDLVDRQAIDHPEQFPDSVRNFMRGMQILGEPFTFGPADVGEFMNSAALEPLEVIPSDICFFGEKDPVYSIYKFCVASAEDSLDTHFANSFHRRRIDRKSRLPGPASTPSTNPLKTNTPHSPRNVVTERGSARDYE